LIDEGKMIADQVSGAAAEQALSTVHEAFEDVRKQMFDAWMASPLRDSEGREKLWLSTTLLTRVEDVLRKRVMNGKVAAKELEALRNTAERKKLFAFNFA
jgi:hypothetical protein